MTIKTEDVALLTEELHADPWQALAMARAEIEALKLDNQELAQSALRAHKRTLRYIDAMLAIINTTIEFTQPGDIPDAT